MSLNDQLKSFKKSLVSQPVYGVKRMAGKPDISQNESRASSTPGTPIANNTKAAYESSMEGKKKNKRSNHGLGTDIIIALSYNKHNGNCLLTVIGAVYSQPANTGAGTHTMSLLYTVVNFLKVKNETPNCCSSYNMLKIVVHLTLEL
jgi:hypothetical protein